MSVVVYKRFKPLVHGKRKEVHVPYTLYTVQEADEKGIPYDRDWRLKFRDLQDLTGVNIVTDDDPPMVVPVIEAKCYPYNPRTGSKKNPTRSLVLPWTRVTSYTRELLVGVPATATNQAMSDKKKRLKPSQFKLFVIMLALMGDPLKVVQQLFGFKYEIQQKRFLRCMMEDERTYDAAKSVAQTVLADAGIEPKLVAEKLWELLQSQDTPSHLKLKGYQDLLDRLGVKDKEPMPEVSGFIAGAMFPHMPAAMPEQLRDMMANEVDNLPKTRRSRRLGPGDNGDEE
jgi:hypothetical protein